MKKSVKCILGIIFIMGLAITSTAFGQVRESQSPSAKKVYKNLPSKMTIDHRAIDTAVMPMFYNKLATFKDQWKSAIQKVESVSGQIEELERLNGELKHRIETCRAIEWRTQDFIDNNCEDDVVRCSKVLYSKCIQQKTINLQAGIHRVGAQLGYPPSESSTTTAKFHIIAAGKTLESWYKAIFNALLVNP